MTRLALIRPIIPPLGVFAAAQLLDLATYNPAYEVNLVVLHAGSLAFAAKWALLLLVTCEAVALTLTATYRRLVPVLLYGGAVAGIIGAITNTIAAGGRP